MKNRFWGSMILCMAIGFFCIFMAIHASIAGDSGSFILLMIMGFGAVSAGMGLNKWGRSIDMMRREQTRTDEIRGSYGDSGDVQHTPLDPITPDDTYPLWQKCNRCNVYLRHHGTEDHPWEEYKELEVVTFDKPEVNADPFLNMLAARDYLGWAMEMPNRVDDWRNDIDGLYPEPDDDDVELYVWGDDKPIRQWSADETRDFQRREAINRKKNARKQPHVHHNSMNCPCAQCESRRMWHG